MSAREELYAALMSGGPHSPDRSELASARIDAVVVEQMHADADWLEGIGEDFAASMLRHQADGEPGEAVPGKASAAAPTATRERTITHTWPGEPPNLTVHLTFGNEWTDDGVKEVTMRVRRAAQVGFNVADYTPLPPSPARLAWYVEALRAVDTYARLDEDDRNQIAAAAIACADKNDLDAAYKAAYDLGRTHAGSSLTLNQLAALQEIAGFCACAAGACPSTVARRSLVGEQSTGCTCARSWGLHSRDCRLYVPGHELATNCPHPATHVDGEWVSCSRPHCPNSERYGKAAERGWANGHMDTWLCTEHAQAGGA